MMLGKRFLMINGERIPNPVDGFGIDFDEDETVNLSEAGTELVRVRRLDKRTFKGTWHLTSFWLKKFETWCSSNTVTLTYKGQEYLCRMRGYSPQMVKNSEYTETSDGLWKISPTLTEI
jgi:hypothetical protein